MTRWFIDGAVLPRWISYVTLPPLDEGRPSDLSGWLARRWKPIVITTLALLLLVNGAWSLVGGRFGWDADPHTRNFLEDWPDLINYTVICPLYLLFGICFVLHIGKLRADLVRSGLFPLLEIDPSHRSRRTRYVVTLGVAFVAAVFLISLYMADLRNLPYLFWFHDRNGAAGRLVEAHARYYMLTNVVLNAVWVLIILGHFEFFAVAAAIGRRLRTLEPTPERVAAFQESRLIGLLKPLVTLYAISKLLVLLAMANLYTWQAQTPQAAGMLDVSILVLAVMGAAVVSFPRYHIQYAICGFLGRAESDCYPDIRPAMIRGFASLADVLILGAALFRLLDFMLERSNIAFRLVG